jgi:hypothetical protein
MYEPWFFDMDGVLSDHMAGACEWSGKSLAELVTPGQWEVPCIDWKALPIAFWATLPLTREFSQVRQKMSSELLNGCPVYILTYACSDDSYAGKLMWLKQHLPAFADQVIFTEHKHLLAAPGRVLYDDRDENIDAWIKAGGIGRLVNRPWNRGHDQLGSIL